MSFTASAAQVHAAVATADDKNNNQKQFSKPQESELDTQMHDFSETLESFPSIRRISTNEDTINTDEIVSKVRQQLIPEIEHAIENVLRKYGLVQQMA